MKTWILILVMAIVTFSTRAFPFIVWGKNHNVSPLIEYLGKALPFAMMGLLVVYSFKNVSFTTSPFGLPELIASFVCVVPSNATSEWKSISSFALRPKLLAGVTFVITPSPTAPFGTSNNC